MLLLLAGPGLAVGSPEWSGLQEAAAGEASADPTPVISETSEYLRNVTPS